MKFSAKIGATSTPAADSLYLFACAKTVLLLSRHRQLKLEGPRASATEAGGSAQRPTRWEASEQLLPRNRNQASRAASVWLRRATRLLCCPPYTFCPLPSSTSLPVCASAEAQEEQRRPRSVRPLSSAASRAVPLRRHRRRCSGRLDDDSSRFLINFRVRLICGSHLWKSGHDSETTGPRVTGNEARRSLLTRFANLGR